MTRQTLHKKARQCHACKLTFAVSFTVAILLIVAGFIVPPMGIIDGSVLTAVGELVIFPALAFGMRAVELGYDLRLVRGTTSMEFSSNTEPNPTTAADERP
ncbi:MAG: hypothetical protein J5486_04245 [Bacteroidaceae bacterium]|nr:hypothetical protein [Bacteroidaceae bacterium]